MAESTVAYQVAEIGNPWVGFKRIKRIRQPQDVVVSGFWIVVVWTSSLNTGI